MVSTLISLASADSNVAIQRLREKHGTLFECLHLTLESLDQWCPEDVTKNMDGGILTEVDDQLPPELKDIRDALKTRRLYGESSFRSFHCVPQLTLWNATRQCMKRRKTLEMLKAMTRTLTVFSYPVELGCLR